MTNTQNSLFNHNERCSCGYNKQELFALSTTIIKAFLNFLGYHKLTPSGENHNFLFFIGVLKGKYGLGI